MTCIDTRTQRFAMDYTARARAAAAAAKDEGPTERGRHLAMYATRCAVVAQKLAREAAPSIVARGHADRAAEWAHDARTYTNTHEDDATPYGYICKTCGGPAPLGIGYVRTGRAAAMASHGRTSCACGYSHRDGFLGDPEEEPMQVHVFTAPGCPQCTATERRLSKLGISFTASDATTDRARAYLTSLGHQQAPVVITNDDSWHGYRPDKIDTLAQQLADAC